MNSETPRPPARRDAPQRVRQWIAQHERALLSFAAIVIFFVLWEWVAQSGWVKPILISSPSRIVGAAQWLFANGFWNDIATSLTEFTLGFALAVLLGVPLGWAMGWSKRINAIFDPFAQALNATPRVALVPLIFIWLGIGLISKVAVVFLGAFFPILLSAASGVQNMDVVLLRCARSFGANRRQMFRTIALPGSVPWLVTGMRIGVGRALVGIVVAELMGASAGVGHMMTVAAGTFQTDKVFVGILCIAGFGYAASEILRHLEERFQRWKPKA